MWRATLALYVRPIIGSSVRPYQGRRKDSFNRDAQAGFRRQYKGVKGTNEPNEKEETLELDEEIDLNEDLNVFDLHKSYDSHVDEVSLRKEQLKYYTIRQKYFKTPQSPNMLTWAEKEQIRNLNKENPDEWTAESLSNAFPATKDIIIKVMKSKWAPINMEAVEKHDRKVKENWELFKTKKLTNVAPELRAHLKRFSNRSFDTAENAYVKPIVDQIEFKFTKPKSQEFSNLIATLKKAKQKQNAIEEKEQPDRLKADEPKLIESRSHLEPTFEENKHELKKSSHIQLQRKDFRRSMTFDELMEKSSKKEEKPTHLSIELTKPEHVQTTNTASQISEENEIEEAAATIDIDKVSNLPAKNEENVDGAIEKFEMKTILLKKFTKSSSSVLQYADRIRIPRKLWQHGKIYQQNDVFYDHTGNMLYRVPGLDGAEFEEVH